jgi:alanyl-tRNA synthetase
VLIEDETEEFIGYDYTEGDIYITKYRKVSQKGKDLYQLVFNLSPFYPEGGGQVGDTGYIEQNGEKVEIIDTKKENKLIIHIAKKLPSKMTGKFKAVVSGNKRRLTTANHSATHLLHHALRELLGTHVEQKGSMVNDKHLRFDFSHFQKVTNEELREIETNVNAAIRANIALNENRAIPITEAEKMGAMMLFGEKYDDVVRVIQFGDSIELCGGTHVNATGEIGFFKIVSESAIAAGVRRVEAITSDAAQKYLFDQIDTLNEVKAAFKNPKDVVKSVSDLLATNSGLEKEVAAFRAAEAKNFKASIQNSIETVNGVSFIGAKVNLGSDEIKQIVFELRKEVENLFMIFGSEANGKALITVGASDDLVAGKDVNVGKVIRDLAKHIQGGGGGQPFFATAGGKNADGLDNAISEAKNYIASL